MDASIIALLGQDGITNGAIYALLALALVLVFAVTRIIFIPQGEFLTWGALTMASLESGHYPATVWLLVGLGALSFSFDLGRVLRDMTFGKSVAINGGKNKPEQWRQLSYSGLRNLAYPLALAALLWMLPFAHLAIGVRVLVVLLIIVPMGPMIYRVAFQPVAQAPVLILLIISVAVHLVMVGLGLLVFGPEGARTEPFIDAQLQIGTLMIGGHAIVVVLASLLLIAALYLFFGHTLYGKALRATAINRNGARLMGISPGLAGRLTFILAAFIGVMSGMLVAPLTTIFYDSGFLIGLKGFVAAIIGGLASYPLAAVGAILVGLLESFSSFWASAFKDVIVFTLIIPVLVWRSLATYHVEEEE